MSLVYSFLFEFCKYCMGECLVQRNLKQFIRNKSIWDVLFITDKLDDNSYETSFWKTQCINFILNKQATI